MKFNFKKIGSIIASSVMLASTIGFAAAASYPEPFVVGGTGNGAVVYGASAAITDITSAIDVQQDLNALVSSGTSTTTAVVSGEATALFTGGTKLYVNDSLNTVKTVLTKTNLPTVLADGSFSGNVDATFSQKIDIGSNPKVTFARQPTSSDDPIYSLYFGGTTSTYYVYNETVTFSKAINATHADSDGEELDIFGSKFTIGSATDDDSLVLLKSAEKVSLDSNSPSQEVTVGGKTYTIELVSASDTAATIKVTDSSGNSESKEITEAASKKVNGLSIAVQTADETNLKLSASVIAGTDKLTFEDGNNVKVGEDDKIIDGTKVDLGGDPDALTAITVSVYAPGSDGDAILAGKSFVDPVFGTIKVDFSGFNIDSVIGSTDTARETISFTTGGDDKMNIKFADYNGNEKTIQFFKNQSTTSSNITTAYTPSLQCSDNGNNITVMEQQRFHKDDCVVVGNEDSGYLLKLKTVRNSSSTTASDDQVEFEDMFSGSTYKTTFTTNNGAGTIDIGGRSYSVSLEGDSDLDSTVYNVSLDYPDSSGDGSLVLYPTIQTSKGAKIMFYEPLTINLDKFSDGNTPGNVTELKFPNGADGYTSITGITPANVTATMSDSWNFTASGGVTSLNTSTGTVVIGNRSFIHTVGQLKYNISTTALGKRINIRLMDVSDSSDITLPAIVVINEKDDNAIYNAIIVELDDGGNSDDGVGIASVEDTWSDAASGWKTTRYSDSKKEDRADLWGDLILLDSSDSDQKTATISYPDEQLYAQIYVGEDTSSITPGTTSGGTGGQILIVKDSEVSSVSGKNLLVVGGSCINAVAAKILGSDVPLCGEDFTAKTQVGAGQYIIKTAASPYNADKIAMLVAGYNAADTVNAVAKAKEGASTDISAEGQVYPIVSASA